MNKEKLEKYLKNTHIALSKYNIYTNILLTLGANAAIYYFFENIVITIINAVLFVVFSAVLIRHRNYLREYDISLLVKAWLTGYWFWLMSVVLFLLQLYFKIDFLFFILEAGLLIAVFIATKKLIDKTFEKNEYTIDRKCFKNNDSNGKNSFEKAPLIAGGLGAFIYAVFRIIFPPALSETVVIWYILSALLFVFVLFAGFLFSWAFLIYMGYLKYFND